MVNERAGGESPPCPRWGCSVGAQTALACWRRLARLPRRLGDGWRHGLATALTVMLLAPVLENPQAQAWIAQIGDPRWLQQILTDGHASALLALLVIYQEEQARGEQPDG